MKTNIVVIGFAFLFSIYPAVSSDRFDIENCPIYQNLQTTSLMDYQQIEEQARSQDQKKKSARHLFVRINQGETEASSLLMKLANSMQVNEASTAFLCLKMMLMYNPV